MPDNWFSPRRIFDFGGRASRREYFLFHAIGLAVLLLPALVMMSVFPLDPGDSSPPSIPFILFGALYMVAELGVVVGFFAVAFRRLHDQGKSAWFMLLGIIPLVGWIFTLVWIFTPGDEYENEYGENPRTGLGSTEAYEGVFD